MKTNTFANRSSVRSFITLLALTLSGSGALAQWLVTPVDNKYNSTANWEGGVINNQFVTASGSYGWTAKNCAPSSPITPPTGGLGTSTRR